MLTVLRCPLGRIIGVCEWWLVNQLGQQDYSSEGKWVWGEQIEFSKGCSPDTFRRLIDQIAEVALKINPQAIGAYWVRRDRTGMKLHNFSRHQLVRIHKLVRGGMRYASASSP